MSEVCDMAAEKPEITGKLKSVAKKSTTKPPNCNKTDKPNGLLNSNTSMEDTLTSENLPKMNGEVDSDVQINSSHKRTLEPETEKETQETKSDGVKPTKAAKIDNSLDLSSENETNIFNSDITDAVDNKNTEVSAEKLVNGSVCDGNSENGSQLSDSSTILKEVVNESIGVDEVVENNLKETSDDKSDNIFEKLNVNVSSDSNIKDTSCSILDSKNSHSCNSSKTNPLSLGNKLKESFKGIIQAAANRVSNNALSVESPIENSTSLAEQCQDISSTSKVEKDVKDKGNLFENMALPDDKEEKTSADVELDLDKSCENNTDDDQELEDMLLAEDIINQEIKDVDESILDQSVESNEEKSTIEVNKGDKDLDDIITEITSVVDDVLDAETNSGNKDEEKQANENSNNKNREKTPEIVTVSETDTDEVNLLSANHSSSSISEGSSESVKSTGVDSANICNKSTEDKIAESESKGNDETIAESDTKNEVEDSKVLVNKKEPESDQSNDDRNSVQSVNDSGTPSDIAQHLASEDTDEEKNCTSRSDSEQCDIKIVKSEDEKGVSSNEPTKENNENEIKEKIAKQEKSTHLVTDSEQVPDEKVNCTDAKENIKTLSLNDINVKKTELESSNVTSLTDIKKDSNEVHNSSTTTNAEEKVDLTETSAINHVVDKLEIGDQQEAMDIDNNKSSNEADINTDLTDKSEDISESRKRKSTSPDVGITVNKKSRLDDMIGGLASRVGKNVLQLQQEAEEETVSSAESEEPDDFITVSKAKLHKMIQQRMEAFVKDKHGGFIADMQKKLDDLHKETTKWKKTAEQLSKQIVELTSLPRHERRKAASRINTRDMKVQVEESKLQAVSQGIAAPLRQNGITPQSIVLGNKFLANPAVVQGAGNIASSTQKTVGIIHQKSVEINSTTHSKNNATPNGRTVREMLNEQRVVTNATTTTAVLTSPPSTNSGMVVDLTEEDDAPTAKRTAGQLQSPPPTVIKPSLVPASQLPGIRPGTYLLQSGPRGGTVLQQIVGSPRVPAPNVVIGANSGPSLLQQKSSPGLMQSATVGNHSVLRQLPPQLTVGAPAGSQVLVRGSTNQQNVRPPPPLQSAPVNRKSPVKPVAKKKTTQGARKKSVPPPDDDDVLITTVTKPQPAKCHPAPLPPQPTSQSSGPGRKDLPPKPTLKISRVQQGIVLSWNMTLKDSVEDITNYQLFAYQEGQAPPTSLLWKKVGDVKALPLPMACTLTQFQEGNKYHFAVRAMDKHQRVGPFSEPSSIHLTAKS